MRRWPANSHAVQSLCAITLTIGLFAPATRGECTPEWLPGFGTLV